jgi:hypothetical protein
MRRPLSDPSMSGIRRGVATRTEQLLLGRHELVIGQLPTLMHTRQYGQLRTPLPRHAAGRATTLRAIQVRMRPAKCPACTEAARPSSTSAAADVIAAAT